MSRQEKSISKPAKNDEKEKKMEIKRVQVQRIRSLSDLQSYFDEKVGQIVGQIVQISQENINTAETIKKILQIVTRNEHLYQRNGKHHCPKKYQSKNLRQNIFSVDYFNHNHSPQKRRSRSNGQGLRRLQKKE